MSSPADSESLMDPLLGRVCLLSRAADLEQSLARGADFSQAMFRPASLPHCHIVVEDNLLSPAHNGATVPQAVFNLLNIYVGIGLLAMPYAFALSGWLGMLALSGTTMLFCYSAKLITRAVSKLPSSEAQTYPALGMAALGPKGSYVVAGFAISEFFGGSCIMVIVIWQQLVQCLPHGGLLGLDAFHAAAIMSTVAILPLLLIPSFKGLSWLSMIGCCSTVLVVLTMVCVVMYDPQRTQMPQQPPPSHDWLQLGIIQAAGIFAVSVSGHSSLPALRNSMQRPQDFEMVLTSGFSAMAVVYGLAGGAGYYYFGSSASPLVTTDLAHKAPFSGHALLLPGVTVDRIVAGCVLINAYTTYPCLILVIQDMAWSVLPWSITQGGGVRAPLAAVSTAFRISVFLAGSLIAYAAYNVLGNVMSLVGGICSMCCSLLLPSTFYLLLHWRGLRLPLRAGVCSIMLGGLALLVLITAENVADILHRLQHRSLHLAGDRLEVPLLGILHASGQQL